MIKRNVVDHMDFTGRGVERIALQGEIIGCLTLQDNSGATFKHLKEWIVNSKVLEIPDQLAEHMEICTALVQL